MRATLIAPRKYVQGRGVIREVGTYVKAIAARPLILWDATVKELVGEAVYAGLAEAGLDAVDVTFAGDSTHAEAERC